MPTNLLVPMSGSATDWRYVGDTNSFDGLSLTMLVKSYNLAMDTDFSEFFEPLETLQQTIIYEQEYETSEIMPVARYGLMPQGGFGGQPGRIQRRETTPFVIREEDHISNIAINQQRAVGTMNDRVNPASFIENRVRQMSLRAKRTETVAQAQCLQGHIRISHPGTATTVDVSSFIPSHNYINYNGWVEDVSAGTVVSISGNNHTAANPLFAKGAKRYEAAMFRSTDGRFGVHLLDKHADVISTFRLIKTYLSEANRNRYTDIIMSRRFLDVLMERNEQLKSFAGMPGLYVFNPQTSSVAGNANYVTNPSNPSMVTFGVGGDIQSIAGLRIVAVEGEYKDPNTGEYRVYWPMHLVCLVARQHYRDPSQKLGIMHYPLAEGSDPGPWMRSEDARAPFTPGMIIQMGNAFLPTLLYPHWVAPVVVAPPGETFGENMMEFESDHLRF